MDRIFSPKDVLHHFDSVSKETKIHLYDEVMEYPEWILVELDPSEAGDESNLELNGIREKQAVEFSKLKTDAPAVIAKMFPDGSYEVLDGRRRVRAAALKGSKVLAFIPKQNKPSR